MPELKRNFTKGRMNKDLDERMVPNGEYRDALNVEVATSEGANVGTVQTLKGNTRLTNLFGANASCVGSIVNERTNKLYWLVSSPNKNTESSKTYSHTDTGGDVVNVVHNIYSDYIMEYDEAKEQTNYIVVENYKVETIISNDGHGTNPNHLHISNLGNADDIRDVGIQPGMDVIIRGVRTSIIKIEKDSASFAGWRVYTEQTGADQGFAQLDNVVAGDSVVFELPFNKRALGFTHFASAKPKKLITGINIIDDLLFWTDGLTEPKKINIERCRFGSQDQKPSVYPSGTNKYYTLLIVNGQVPHPSNGRLSTDDSTYPTGFSYVPLTYRETTVIKKSPTAPLRLTMSNTTRADIVVDGSLIVNSNVALPFAIISGTASTTSSNFFFDTANGERLGYGDPTPALQFPQKMDWQSGDLIEFYPEDEDAGTSNDVLVLAKVESVTNGDTFVFEIRTISPDVTKPITTYNARLKQEDPLFEFKFPRFAYRWKYEDGEYSTYSPFSEVAFLPEAFDYLPKKGFNLGMTNNLRYLALSGFKPITTPLDVVEIDVLYKESNSANVYTVDTIKSPSSRNNILNTDNYSGDNGWFGRVKHEGNWVEAPRTKTTVSHMVGNNIFDGTVDVINGVYFYGLVDDFMSSNMKIGDTIVFPSLVSGLAAPIKIASMRNSTVTANQSPTQDMGDVQTRISLTADGEAVEVAAGPIWFSAGVEIEFFRTIAKRPAFFVEYPQGSLEIKTDMIHATLPANQLLRPWDNVPIKALSQEITGNRIVYGNYTQNYNLLDDNNDLVINSFQPIITKRKNVPNNVRYNDSTALRNPTNGTTIDWWDIRNSIVEFPSLPERSIKSLRDYQVGVVYMDEFGRQTPVQTHETGVLKVKKDDAVNYNQLSFHLRDASDPAQVANARYPEWASHYKYYLKENSNEYYNLAMDRFYDAEDGNLWLSFPSSERNKVDEDTYLILKKRHDQDVFVAEEARFKILAIANEAPLFVKTKTNTFGILSNVSFPNQGQPMYQRSHVDVPGSVFESTGSYGEVGKAKNRVIRISDATNISDWYDIVSITSLGTNKRVLIRKPFGSDVSFTTDDGTSSGVFQSNISIEIAEREIKNLAEFEGRFFAKILNSASLQKNILAFAPDKKYVTTDAVKLGNLFKSTNNRNTKNRPFWHNDVPSKQFFVDSIQGVGVHVGDPSLGINNRRQGKGLHGNNSIIDISFHHFQQMEGTGNFNPPWHIKNTDDPGVNAYHKGISSKLLSAGQLFKWKGDSTHYRIKSTTSHSVENYWGKENASAYRRAKNHREKFRVVFEPGLGVAGVEDAIGGVSTGYNPFIKNRESGTEVVDDWANFDVGGNSYDNRTIEFLEEFVSDNSYSSDNPAVWETEPKENVDIDIYNEASDSLAIGYEWNAFLNKFVFYPFSRSWNPLDYYNCFSFANGVESNRLRDDYNAVTIDKGPKVSTVLAQQYKQEQRKSGLIYSGIYNSTSGVNNLNQFIQAEKITKDLNPTYGSIQKLFARDTDLITLCEDRIIRVLSNKDAVFNADGNINLTSTNNVLGQATPYAGDYGISTNPESFAVDQYRAYFTDKSRGSVIRLSMDGLTPISDVGMRDWFKDSFKPDNIVLLGSYDDNKKVYNLTLDTTNLGKQREILSSGPPLDSIKTYFGVTGNGGNGLVPGSVITKDWAPFDVNNNINFNASSISFIDVAVNDYDNTDQTAWLQTLKTAIDAGTAYNLAIGIDETEGYGGGPVGENVYTVVSVSAPALSVTGVLYYRIHLTHDIGTTDLHAHRAYIIYYLKNPLVSKKRDVTSPYTVSFSEDTKGWTSFKSLLQEAGASLNDKFFTFKGAEIYEHHLNPTRNNFYENQYDSIICAIFNDMPSSVKSFGSLSYEGTQSKIDVDLTDQEYYNNTAVQGWYAESVETDLETGYVPEFKDREGKWFNYIRGNQENTLANLNVKQFSTQGIGTPSGITLFASTATGRSKLTTKDIGDND